MKLTVDDARMHGFQGRNKIRLNGMALGRGVVMADEENGCIEMLRIDLYKNRMKECPTEMLYGKVQILLGDAV